MEASILSCNSQRILEKMFIVAIWFLTTGCRHRIRLPLIVATDDLSVKYDLLKLEGNLSVANSLVKHKIIKKRVNIWFVTYLVEECKRWHLKGDENISESQPIANEILRVLVYKPVFWIPCFHMSHCCGMESWKHIVAVWHTRVIYVQNIKQTLSGFCTTSAHMTISIAASRLGARPHRQADCRSSRTFATGSPGHTLCWE